MSVVAKLFSGQVIRFLVVGTGLNAALYVAYLVLTHTALAARPAMTVVYIAGVLLGFFLNRRFTFRFVGSGRAAMMRYLGAYGLGWAVDWTGLWFFVERVSMPHETVQLAMAVVVAALMFVLQRYWVFRTPSAQDVTSSLRPASL